MVLCLQYVVLRVFPRRHGRKDRVGVAAYGRLWKAPPDHKISTRVPTGRGQQDFVPLLSQVVNVSVRS